MSIHISLHDINWGDPLSVDPRYAEAQWREGFFWAEFASDVGSGRVMVGTERLRPPDGYDGQLMSVETGQRREEDIRLLLPGEHRAPRLVALPTPGDFQVIGEVRVIQPHEETPEPFQAYVIVGNGWFTIDISEAKETIAVGDWLSFTAVGLQFFDDGMYG